MANNGWTARTKRRPPKLPIRHTLAHHKERPKKSSQSKNKKIAENSVQGQMKEK